MQLPNNSSGFIPRPHSSALNSSAGFCSTYDLQDYTMHIIQYLGHCLRGSDFGYKSQNSVLSETELLQ